MKSRTVEVFPRASHLLPWIEEQPRKNGRPWCTQRLVTFDLAYKSEWSRSCVKQPTWNHFGLRVPFFGYLRNGAPRGGQFHRDVDGDENIWRPCIVRGKLAACVKMRPQGSERGYTVQVFARSESSDDYVSHVYGILNGMV